MAWMRTGVPAAIGALAAAAMFAQGGGGLRACELEADAAMVRLYARHGWHGQARAAAEALVERPGSGGYARLARAAACYHAGEAEAAVAQYRDLLAEDPAAPVLLYDLGMSLRLTGRAEEWRDAMRRAEDGSRGVLPGLAAACRRAVESND
jgi:hypothetical protein